MTGKKTSWMKRLLFLVGSLVLLSGGVLWWQWTPFTAWYHVRGLSRAAEEERERWSHSLIALQETVLPGLFRCLQQDDERVCDNVRFALGRIIQSWPPDDERRADLAGRFAQHWPACGVAGQRALLDAAQELLSLAAVPPPPLTANLARLLALAATQTDSSVRARAVELANHLLERDPSAEVVAACRSVADQALQDAQPEVRMQAIRLAQARALELLEKVVPLLDDSSAEIRRMAMLAVGSARDAIAEDDLLRWLHDPDVETRKLCEQALRGRGLQDQHLKLGRLLTDRQPGTRLQVLEQLHRASDLEPGVWLRRLSHDSSPAVRAAAVRAAAEQPFVDLSDRLEQMAQNDPSTTVRELARFYSRTPKSAPRP